MSTAVPWRWYAWWLLTFLGFPLGGLPAIAGGGIDDPVSAVLGGGAAGLVIGAAQGLALGRLPLVRAHAGSPRRLLLRWTTSSALGLAVGLAVGSAVVGYGTSAGDLATQGLISGAGIGAAQAWAGRPWFGGRFAALWMTAVTVLWPLGWMVTRWAGVSVEDRFAVFGAAGALAFTALSGLLLRAILAPARFA